MTLKPRDLVALAELAVDVVAGPGHGLGEELGHEVVGLALADQLGFSAASASFSPTQNGTPKRSQTAWLAPWWSGWACVSA